jgi:hypothetical protein
MKQEVAIVLLERWIEPDLRAVAAAVRARHPETPASVPDARDARAASGASVKSPFFLCAGEIVVVMSLAAEAPRDDGLLARSAATWPEVVEIFSRHRAHLIVSVMGENKNPLASARVLTAAVGALIASLPGCLGVLWGGRVAHPAERWREMSRAAFAPYPNFPFTLWVGIHPFREDGAVGAVTLGLSAFVGREVEFEGEGLDLSRVINNVAGLAVYMIERGGAIPDGDTFGASKTERLKLHHATSRRFSGLPVLFATASAA